MPPVNTPARSPASPATPPSSSPAGRPLTPLSYLSSPAPDLASTLHTSSSSSAAAERADEANVSFLRDSLHSLDQTSPVSRGSRIDAQRDPRPRDQGSAHPSSASPSYMQNRTDVNEDASRQERLRRVLGTLNRLHEPSAPSSSAYSNRTPSPNRQSLYDWAPGTEEHNEEDSALYNILRNLRRQQPDTHPEILRILSQSQLETTRQRERDTNALAAAENDMTDAIEQLDRLERRNISRRERERRARESESFSLRSRAMLQRARQDGGGGGGSPSGTERMLRYVMERERSGVSEEEERARGSGWFRPGQTASREETSEQSGGGGGGGAGRGHWLLPPPAEARDRERQERLEAFRRSYLTENMPQRLPRVSTPPAPTSAAAAPSESNTNMLENALKYLSDLRFCTRYEDALSAALDHGLATREFLADKHEDFVMDLDELPQMALSSWLQPGGTFEGHQHATIAALTHHNRAGRSRVEQINPNYRTSNAAAAAFDHPPGSTRVMPYDALRPWQFTLPHTASSSSKEAHDHWPVRVIIHAIDREKMTLQGTMEAYDVPQHPSGVTLAGSSASIERPKAGKKHAPITTYLEGHIIDLRTHGFLTPEAKDTKSNPQSSPNSIDTVQFPSASAQTDAQTWLNLPPFSDLASSSPSASSTNTSSSSSSSSTASAANTTSRLLLSKTELARLQREYIFMRWKERCFVHSLHNDPCTAPPTDRHSDQDRGHGLTISGFYYVSLRRSDGAVEGLYFDPMSTPFQHLRLKGTGKGWGSWEFR